MLSTFTSSDSLEVKNKMYPANRKNIKRFENVSKLNRFEMKYAMRAVWKTWAERCILAPRLLTLSKDINRVASKAI